MPIGNEARNRTVLVSRELGNEPVKVKAPRSENSGRFYFADYSHEFSIATSCLISSLSVSLFL